MSVNLIDSSDITVSQTNDDIELNVNDSVVEAFTGNLADLTTTDKSNLVNAINELDENAIEEKSIPTGTGLGNGYIKFKNGIIYEWKLLQVKTTSGVYGPLWYSDHSLGNWAVPILNFFSYGSAVNNYNYWTTINGMTNNSAGTIRMYRANNASGNNVYVSVWALGIWK